MNFIKSRLIPLLARLIPVAVALLILAGSWCRWLDIYEYQTYDWRFRLKPKPPISDKIAIIGIWDDSLERIGRWPFHRGYHAALTDMLRASGARMVGFDILFVETGEGDDEFAAATKSFGGAYFCEAFREVRANRGRLIAEEIEASLNSSFQASAAGIGHVNMQPDADGKRRRIMPLISTAAGDFRWQLGILMAADYLGIPRSSMGYDAKGNLRLGDMRLPVDRFGSLLVNFAGKWTDTFTHVSYASIVSSYQQIQRGEKPEMDLSVLKDKVCFVGLTATGSHDNNPIPLEVTYPQVGIYANIFNMILNRAFLIRLGPAWNLAILLLLGWISVSLTHIPKLPASIGAYVGALFIFVAAAIALFAFGGIWIDLFYPAAASGVIYLSGILQRTMAEKRKRELIEAELVIASNIQKSFLPSSIPEFEALDLAVYMKPAKQVGGDLYTLFKIDDNRYGLMLGDVSGKGTPAALFMAKAVSEFKFHARGVSDPAKALAALNDSLSSEESGGLFVTMSYGVFHLDERFLRLSSGGHLPLLRVRRDGTHEYLNAEGGMPLALMPGVEFSDTDISLESGDIFVLYSDGIQEAKNMRRQDFELDRLAASIKRVRELPSKEILSHVLEDVHQFVRNAPQHDDMTLIIAKVVIPA